MTAPCARLFVALWPDDATRGRLVAARDRWTWSPTARPTPDANLHVTLHFIGDVARERVPDVASGLDVPFAPFDLRFGHARVWSNGIAALEPAAPPSELVALHRGLAEALVGSAMPVEERAWRPHATMARDARGSVAPDEEPWTWHAAGFALLASRGGRYTIVANYPLAE